MIDFRPVGYVIGLLVAVLGATMLVPMSVDAFLGNGNWQSFLESAAISIGTGGILAIACSNSAKDHLTLQQTFLMPTLVWLALPLFGAMPFLFGATQSAPVDAFFEAMSGFTTTGATVLTGLDDLPHGILLWRGMLQWFGGVGIIVVAMVFLPELGVGGMQIFKTEAFDVDSKILPQAKQIAAQISVAYVLLTVACGMIYAALGMNAFDAIVHSLTTISTGGFANYDSSFGQFSNALHYAAVIFMIAAALPFVRYVQFLSGAPKPLFYDSQVRAFVAFVACVTTMITLWLWQRDGFSEPDFREALFNGVSIITGTGYASADYMLWGSFPVTLLFFAGLVGGCAGSTSCSVKIFRYQLLFASFRNQIRRIHSPHGVFTARYNGRIVDDDILSSVMAFFVMFILSIGVLAVLLGMSGMDFIGSVSGAATAIANIGPGLGAEIGPAGNFQNLGDLSKWLLAAGMLVGRLELLVVLAVLRPRFWTA